MLHLSLKEYSAVENPKRLVQALTDAINADPIFTADLFYQRAQADLALKDYKAALKDLTDAILKEPMRYQYYLMRACVYHKLGHPVIADKDIVTARYSNKEIPNSIEYDADTEPDKEHSIKSIFTR